MGEESRSSLPPSDVEDSDDCKRRHDEEGEHEDEDEGQRFVVVVDHFGGGDAVVGARVGLYQTGLNEVVRAPREKHRGNRSETRQISTHLHSLIDEDSLHLPQSSTQSGGVSQSFPRQSPTHRQSSWLFTFSQIPPFSQMIAQLGSLSLQCGHCESYSHRSPV
jgi:hypothetical protein